MLIAAGIGGLVMAALSKIPVVSCLNYLFCVGIWGSGILAVWIYRQSEKGQPGLTVGQGALIGLLAGVVAAVLAVIFDAMFSGAGMLSSLSMVQKIPVMSSAAADIFRQAMAASGGVIGKLVCNLVLYPLFGAAGGVIATALIWKK
jgi:hypothetical protein